MAVDTAAGGEWRRIDALLDQALAQPHATRESWLRHACGEDARLLARLCSLLRQAEAEAAWEVALRAPALWRELEADLDAGVANDEDRTPADGHCGAWRLLREIGHGGMADVFLAEREASGVTLRAAIKRLRPERSGGELERRFLREGRILAQLQDERIARLLDAGVDARGRPWLATEYIEGERIDVHAQRHALGLEARLHMFLDVAEAVLVAHRQLIVHRDLKPANVLVTAQGKVKLLDFGIAKLLQDPGGDGFDPPTRLELRVMTPEYAAPEQLLSQPVGTATDVYQLGLLLFELVTSVRPFPRDGSTPAEFERSVVEQPAPRASSVAKAEDRRRTLRLRRRLQGDLDAILACALEKSPSARYAGVEALAADVRRFLGGRAVHARRVGRARRLRLFLRRHALAASLVALAAISLAGYAVLATLQLRATQREAELNLAVRGYLEDLFRGADPRAMRGPARDAGAVLDAGIERARARFGDQPLLLSELLAIASEIRIGQGDYPVAFRLVEESVMLRRAHGVAGDPRLGFALELKGRAMHYTGRYREAEAPLREAIGLCDARPEAGPCLALASTADLMQSRGDYAEAETLLRRALARAPAGSDSEASLRRDLANVLRDAWRLDEAEASYAQAMRYWTDGGDALHLGLANAQAGLARLRAQQGRGAEARELAERALVALRRHYGDSHPALGVTRHALALGVAVEGDPARARALLDETLARDHPRFAPVNVLRAYAFCDRGWFSLALGDLEGAAADFDEAQANFEHVSGEEHPRLADVMLGRAVLARHRGDAAGAARWLARARDLRERGFGAAHPQTEAIRAWQDWLEGRGVGPRAPAFALEAQRLRWAATHGPGSGAMPATAE
jgi:tetratricopeptide (TPR) repeat protein/tRNA A-37 threonylcarbamoyl transferase component Bud32